MAQDIKFEGVRWSIFVVLILTYTLSYFHRMAPGVMSEYLMAAFQTTGTRLGALSAIYFFVYAAMQLPAGVLADTLGNRTSIIGGNIIAGLGSILFGMATSFEMACAGRFMVGLGVSVVFISIMKNNSVWFHARMFGLMSGLTVFLGNMGAVASAGPLSFLLSILTWRTIFISIGVFSLFLSVAGYFLVHNRPEDLGYKSPNPREPLEKTTRGQDSWIKNLAGVVQTLKLWPGFWVHFGTLGGLYSFMGLWGMPYLRDAHGLARSDAAHYMTIMLFCFALGSLAFGWFSDFFGQRKSVLITGLGVYFCSWLLLMFSGWSPGGFGLFIFGLMGFSGGSVVITFACAKEVINPELSGMAVSIVNTGCFIGTAVMQPLFGWIADHTWDGTITDGIRIYNSASYENGFVLMLIFTMIGFIGACFVCETHCRNIAKKS